MVIIITFFIIHWYSSAFIQSFFQHRYMAHKMFVMSPFWEKAFYLMTALFQGSSFLHPKSYAILHHEHHTHSDTKEDPHSPHVFKDIFTLMWNTKRIYTSIQKGEFKNNTAFASRLLVWPSIDRFFHNNLTRLCFAMLYTWLYITYAPSAWFFLLLPIHFLMGPIHGAFINWCGHKYGYRNFETNDKSKNTFLWDLFFMGECFQNNHHRYPTRANFAVKKLEFDILYPVIKLFDKIGIIRLQNP